MLWKVHVHFQRPSASMDLPAKVAIVIKNLPAYSCSVVRASKLELGGPWVWNFFLTFLMLDSSLFQIILNSLGLVRWWTAQIMSPIKSTMTDRSVLPWFSKLWHAPFRENPSKPLEKHLSKLAKFEGDTS